MCREPVEFGLGVIAKADRHGDAAQSTFPAKITFVLKPDLVAPHMHP
jgi:hypothetical protein